jgi:plasmid stabilization system protein ParE
MRKWAATSKRCSILKQIRWSPRAAGDLSQIFEYIRKDKPEAGRQVALAIYKRAGALKDFPTAVDLDALKAHVNCSCRRSRLCWCIACWKTQLKSQPFSTVRNGGHDELLSAIAGALVHSILNHWATVEAVEPDVTGLAGSAGRPWGKLMQMDNPPFGLFKASIVP